jgi:hypothetical protein
MATSQSIRKGTWSSRIARSKPQNDWESFSPATGIPKDAKGVIPLPTETIRSNRAEPEAERLVQGGKTVEAPSPQQQIPRRRGRPRKNKEVEEARVSEESRARSVAEELLMHAIRWSPLEDRATKAGAEQGKWIPQERMIKSHLNN